MVKILSNLLPVISKIGKEPFQICSKMGDFAAENGTF
jgi:hypothetical protein